MPAAHYVHPDYGLLCPMPRLRRRVRIAVACMALALIGLAVLRASNSPPSALAVAGLEEGASSGTMPDSGQAPAATLAARLSLSESAQTGGGKTTCEQDSSAHRTWASLDGKCVAANARKPRMVRVATDRPALAAITIGTLVAPERAPEPVSRAASVPTAREADPSKSAPAAPADTASVTERPQQPAAASKKPQKTARNHNRRRDPAGNDALWWREIRADAWDARGYGAGERDYGRGGYAREGSFGSYGFFR